MLPSIKTTQTNTTKGRTFLTSTSTALRLTITTTSSSPHAQALSSSLDLHENSLSLPPLSIHTETSSRSTPFNLFHSIALLQFPDLVPSHSNKPSIFHYFVNLPNFISFARLISSPLLAWYLHFFFPFSKILCYFI